MADCNTVGSIITEIQTLYNTKVNSEDIGVVISENKSVILDDFITSDEVELHAITREYPEMNEEEKSRLEKDIVMSGKVYAPFLATVENEKLKIFDGRNRYNFLKKISEEYYDIDNASGNYQDLKDTEVVIEIFITVDEKTKSYKSLDTEAIRLIADSYNLSRRHLTATQKAIIAFSERFEEQREFFREQSEEAQKTNTASKKKTKTKDRAVFDETLAETVGGNKDYISKWKKVKDLLKQIPELYRKLSEIAYLYNGNFQEIVYLLKFKDKFTPCKKIKDENGKEISLLEGLCRAYIEEKKKNDNLPFGKNEKERRQAVDKLREKLSIPVVKRTKSQKISEELQVEGLWVFVNNDSLGKVTMERITAAIKYVLRTNDIDEEFKCYFAKAKDTTIKTAENKLTVENGNFKEIVEIKSDEVSEFVYEDD